MTDWRKTCDEVLAAANEATERPWCDDFEDDNTIRFIAFDGPRHKDYFQVEMSDANRNYLVEATNSAPRLARFARRLVEHIAGELAPLPLPEGLIQSYWEQSK
jgi:hypothetical protein